MSVYTKTKLNFLASVGIVKLQYTLETLPTFPVVLQSAAHVGWFAGNSLLSKLITLPDASYHRRVHWAESLSRVDCPLKIASPNVAPGVKHVCHRVESRSRGDKHLEHRPLRLRIDGGRSLGVHRIVNSFTLDLPVFTLAGPGWAGTIWA